MTFVEPAYAASLDWLLCDALGQIAGGSAPAATAAPAEDGAYYFRLSTRPIDQAPFEAARARLGDAVLRRQVVAGAYRLVDAHQAYPHLADAPVVQLAASGAVLPEVLAAAAELADEGIAAHVVDVTSLDRLYRAWQRTLRQGVRTATVPSVPGALRSAFADRVPVVTVHDAASHAMAWLGSARRRAGGAARRGRVRPVRQRRRAVRAARPAARQHRQRRPGRPRPALTLGRPPVRRRASTSAQPVGVGVGVAGTPPLGVGVGVADTGGRVLHQASFQVDLGLPGAADGDVVVRLEQLLLVEVEHAHRQRGGLLALQAAQPGAAGGALHHQRGAAAARAPAAARSTCRAWVCPASTSGQVPESGPADAGSCTSAMFTGRGELRTVAASCSPAPITWSATCWVSPLPAGEVFLSGVNRGSPMPAMVSPATVVVVLSSTIAFGCGPPRRRSSPSRGCPG